MSGIFGHYINNKSFSRLPIMRVWNSFYGRNRFDFYSSESISLGCCYEHLTNSPALSNSVINLDNKFFVIDSILFNRNHLINKLSSVKNAASLSDEELLAYYISSFGMDSLKEVNGDFAGAIYNSTDNTLTLFRNHLGTRTLFYYCKDNQLFFSTDIRGITAISELDITVNEEWLYKSLSGYAYMSETATEFSSILCVPPAGYITFDLSSDTLSHVSKLYWEPGSKKIRLKSDSDYCKRLRAIIEDSIKIRMDVFDGKIGAELSGGLDSSVIDILINRLGREGIFFSWSYSPDDVPLAEHDERKKVIDVCNQEKITCTFRRRMESDGTSSNLANAMKSLGIDFNKAIPFTVRNVLPPYVNTFPMCDALDYVSAQGSKVVFSGHGGDEGVSHRSDIYELLYHKEYYHYLRALWSSTNGSRKRIIRFVKSLYNNSVVKRKLFSSAATFSTETAVLLNSTFCDKMSYVKAPSHFFMFDPVEYVKQGGSRNRLDLMTLFGSYSQIRYMTPFLDYRAIDYALSIPRYLYNRGKINRWIYREAFKDILPRSLYLSDRKMDGSLQNFEEDPNWYTIYDGLRSQFMKYLNREKWSKYLNFDEIDKWIASGAPKTTEESALFDCFFAALLRCSLIDSTIEQSRIIAGQYASSDLNQM